MGAFIALIASLNDFWFFSFTEGFYVSRFESIEIYKKGQDFTHEVFIGKAENY